MKESKSERKVVKLRQDVKVRERESESKRKRVNVRAREYKFREGSLKVRDSTSRKKRVRKRYEARDIFRKWYRLDILGVNKGPCSIY